MSDSKRIEISMCATCPFSLQDHDPWHCQAVGRRMLSRAEYFEAGPPDWCPLRKADHVVTLRVK